MVFLFSSHFALQMLIYSDHLTGKFNSSDILIFVKALLFVGMCVQQIFLIVYFKSSN